MSDLTGCLWTGLIERISLAVPRRAVPHADPLGLNHRQLIAPVASNALPNVSPTASLFGAANDNGTIFHAMSADYSDGSGNARGSVELVFNWQEAFDGARNGGFEELKPLSIVRHYRRRVRAAEQIASVDQHRCEFEQGFERIKFCIGTCVFRLPQGFLRSNELTCYHQLMH